MIPDKIYIDIIKDEDGYLFSESLQDNGGEVYIRKDALLEWLEEQQKQVLIYQGGCVTGTLIYQEVIDKINEL